jgi:hypothetical protein
MLLIAGLAVFVEEWLWDRLTLAMAYVARLPILRQLELWMATLPAWGALICFVFPGLILLPVNIVAILLTTRGQAMLGTTLLILAKLVGTALLARVFAVTKPTLLKLGWFRALHEGFFRLKTALFQRIQQLGIWPRILAVKARLASLTHRWRGGHLKRRWKAVVHWMRARWFRKPTG